MPPKKGKVDAPTKGKSPQVERKVNLIGDIPSELFIKCKNLLNKDTLIAGDKSDPFVIVSYRNTPGGKWSKVGQTEVVDDNLNPVFKKTFIFEADPLMELCFEVFDEDPTKNELLGFAQCFLKELTDQMNTEVVKPLKIDKTGRNVGTIILSTKANVENIAVLEERAKKVKQGGFDLEKEEEEKMKVGEEIKKFVEGSGLPIAFKVICAEIVEKEISKEEVYSYAAKRMREIGEQIQKLVKNIRNGNWEMGFWF